MPRGSVSSVSELGSALKGFYVGAVPAKTGTLKPVEAAVKLLLIKLQKMQMRMIEHVVTQNHGPGVPQNSPKRKEVAIEMLKRGKDFTQGEAIEVSVSPTAVEFTDMNSTEITQVPLEDVVAHHQLTVNLSQFQAHSVFIAIVEDQGKDHLDCHVLRCRKEVAGNLLDLVAAARRSSSASVGSLDRERPNSFRGRSGTATRTDGGGGGDGVISFNIGLHRKSSLRVSRKAMQRSQGSLRGTSAAGKDGRKSRKSYGDSFSSFGAAPSGAGAVALNSNRDGGSAGDRSGSGGGGGVNGAFSFNFDVEETVMEQEDTLGDVDDDLFGESAGNAIDDVFGFGFGDTEDGDVVYGAGGGGFDDDDVDNDSGGGGAGAVADEMPDYSVPIKKPKKKVAAAPAAPARSSLNPPLEATAARGGGGGGGMPEYAEPTELPAAGAVGGVDDGPVYAEPDAFFDSADTGLIGVPPAPPPRKGSMEDASATGGVGSAADDPQFYSVAHWEGDSDSDGDGDGGEQVEYLSPLSLNPCHWSDDEDVPDTLASSAAAVGFGSPDPEDDDASESWGFGDELPPTPPSRPSLARVTSAPEPPPRSKQGGVGGSSAGASSHAVSVYPMSQPAAPVGPYRRPVGKPLFESKFLPAYVFEKMGRKDAELLFITGKTKIVGQFLVRQSETHEDQFTLCVLNVGNKITNMRLQTNDRDRIAIPIAAVRGGPFFRTIEGLVTYYQKKRVPSLRADNGGPFFLTNPILKDKRAATVRRLLQEDRANKHVVTDDMVITEEEEENGNEMFPTAGSGGGKGEYRSVADLERERKASSTVYATPEALRAAVEAKQTGAPTAAGPRPPPRPSMEMVPKKRLYNAAELSSRVLMEILSKRSVEIPVNANRKVLVEMVESHGGVTASVRPKKR